ncbi:MAG: hypothetical protein AAFY57_19720, partial [Cyanobacteria bacterium J06642_2]
MRSFAERRSPTIWITFSGSQREFALKKMMSRDRLNVVRMVGEVGGGGLLQLRYRRRSRLIIFLRANSLCEPENV